MLQGPEILVILLVALVVFGPERLPELAKKAGRWTAELRKAAREIRQGLEAEVGDVKGLADEITSPLKEVRSTLDETARQAATPIEQIKDEIRQFEADHSDSLGPESENEDPDAAAETSDGKAADGPLEWVGPVPENGPTPADSMRDLEAIEPPEDQADLDSSES